MVLQGERRPGLGAQRRLRALPGRRRHLPRRRRHPRPGRRRPRSAATFAADADVVKVQFRTDGDRRRGQADRGAQARRRTCRCPAATCAPPSSPLPSTWSGCRPAPTPSAPSALRRIMPIPEGRLPHLRRLVPGPPDGPARPGRLARRGRRLLPGPRRQQLRAAGGGARHPPPPRDDPLLAGRPRPSCSSWPTELGAPPSRADPLDRRPRATG